MRPPGVAGALVTVVIGAILTYAVSFAISGVSIHTVGVIIMAVGAVALAILLVRSVTTSRRRVKSRRPPAKPGPSADGVRQKDTARAVLPIAVTRVSTEVYSASEELANHPQFNGEAR